MPAAAGGAKVLIFQHLGAAELGRGPRGRVSGPATAGAGIGRCALDAPRPGDYCRGQRASLPSPGRKSMAATPPSASTSKRIVAAVPS